MLEMNDSPQPADLVVISAELAIPPAELHFRFSRSGGPGGQHVNRSETRVELLFDVAGSPSLNEAQRRVATRPTGASRERRLAGKRQRGQVKRTRRGVGRGDYE